MREKAEILFDAVTGIRPELVEEAQDYVFRRRTAWRRLVPLAACFALALCLGWYGLLLHGGFGGGSDMASSGANSAPQPPASADSASTPGAEPAPPVEGAGDFNYSGAAPEEPEAVPGDTAPGDAGSAPAELTFTARVVELGQAFLVVRPLPGGDLPAGTDRAEVVLEGMAEVPELQVGDKVRVTFTGEIQETYPLRITGVTAITLENE